MKRVLVCVLCIATLITSGMYLSGQGMATILIKQFSTREITSRSDCIAMGVVTDIAYHETDNRVLTIATIECSRIFKGNPADRAFYVVQEGGKTATYTRAVYGAPSYSVDEEVILFLENNAYQNTLKRVIGLNLGKYSIVEDEATGEKIAVSDQRDLHFAQPVKDPFAPKIIRKPLDEFITEIQEAVQAEQSENADTDNESAAAGLINTAQQNEQFDWITFIRRMIVRYANAMADEYEQTTAQIRKAGR